MASESETWWSQHYTGYSIRDLQALPIFNKFIAMHYPFERASDERSESFASAGTIDTYEWSALDTKEGEKFTHDRSNDLWHYEHRYHDKDAHVTVRSWLSPEAEWGEVDQHFLDYVIKENWKLQGSVRHYERVTEQGGEKRGIKTGWLLRKRAWNTGLKLIGKRRAKASLRRSGSAPEPVEGKTSTTVETTGGEKFGTESGEHTEKKSWHTRGDKDWGNVHGEACGKIWDENWDISKAKRSEEKLTQDGDRRRGFRYLREGPDWYKQEWDGLAILGVQEGVEKLQEAGVRQVLDEVSSNSHDSVLKGEHTIEMLLREAPHFADEVEDLKKERIDIPKPDNGTQTHS